MARLIPLRKALGVLPPKVRQLIDTLTEIITHQTTLIESTKAEVLEVKHEQMCSKPRMRNFMKKSGPSPTNLGLLR